MKWRQPCPSPLFRASLLCQWHYVIRSSHVGTSNPCASLPDASILPCACGWEAKACDKKSIPDKMGTGTSWEYEQVTQTQTTWQLIKCTLKLINQWISGDRKDMVHDGIELSASNGEHFINKPVSNSFSFRKSSRQRDSWYLQVWFIFFFCSADAKPAVQHQGLHWLHRMPKQFL